MGGVEFASEQGWILRHRHRLGSQDRLDGAVALRGIRRQPVDCLPNNCCNRGPLLFGFTYQLLIAVRIEQDLQPVV
ncbi:MAG: hypothetical protein HW416_3051 [Chloroflexi bacterium]|nr:hypothetical protein [Chloroflexota bacterium]